MACVNSSVMMGCKILTTESTLQATTLDNAQDYCVCVVCLRAGWLAGFYNSVTLGRGKESRNRKGEYFGKES